MRRDINQVEHRRIDHPLLHVALYQPEIPANTGNIARLCGAAEIPLHLIHPLGFQLDDRRLKRAGLDYWPEVDVRTHRDFDHFLETFTEGGRRMIALSSHGSRPYVEAEVKEGDCLLFGPETRGLPSDIRAAFPCYRIPVWGRVRSLNLSTSVGIVAYHCLYRMGRF